MITGCYKTAEVLFVAAPNQILAMYAHFKNMGPGNSSPYKSGTKTTERIISELQGKTTQTLSLDAQPTTVGDVISKISNVQFIQPDIFFRTEKPIKFSNELVYLKLPYSCPFDE